VVTAKESYQAAREAAKAAIAVAQGYMRDAFNTGAQALLDEIGANSFSWVQFTPYFNDGDACYFSVRTDLYYLHIDDENGDDYYISSYRPSEDDESKRGMNGKFKKVQEFIDSFDEDDMEAMFGDHVEVTVTRDGVTTEEYQHD
jgi:hypothetical protein